MSMKPRKPVQWNEIPHAGADIAPMVAVRITFSGTFFQFTGRQSYQPISMRGMGGDMDKIRKSRRGNLLRKIKQIINGTYLPNWASHVPLSDLCPVIAIRNTSRRHYRKQMRELKKKYKRKTK